MTPLPFVDRALQASDSLLQPGRRVWTVAALEALVARLAEVDDPPGTGFAQRWQTRLATTPEEVVAVAAEVVFVHLVVANDLAAATKRRLVTDTLLLADPDAVLPAAAAAALERGLTATGIAYKTRRLSQLRFLAAAALAFKQQPAAQRRRLLAEPWATKDWLFTLPVAGAHAQRALLLHLVHPADFEPIVSERLKAQIAEVLADHVPAQVHDVDQALGWIRRALEPRYGAGFSFTAPDVRACWAQDPSGQPA